jgi:hypothetical protein
MLSIYGYLRSQGEQFIILRGKRTDPPPVHSNWVSNRITIRPSATTLVTSRCVILTCGLADPVLCAVFLSGQVHYLLGQLDTRRQQTPFPAAVLEHFRNGF